MTFSMPWYLKNAMSDFTKLNWKNSHLWNSIESSLIYLPNWPLLSHIYWWETWGIWVEQWLKKHVKETSKWIIKIRLFWGARRCCHSSSSFHSGEYCIHVGKYWDCFGEKNDFEKRSEWTYKHGWGCDHIEVYTIPYTSLWSQPNGAKLHPY